MDRRSMAVLNQLVQSDSYITIQELAAKFNVSRRTIYNDLEKINDWLKEIDLPGVRQIREKGIYLDQNVKENISSKLTISDNSYYEFSHDERKAWIYIYVSIAETPYFLDDLKELFQVSRNTVLDDIKKLKEEMALEDLELFSEHQRGYQISGDEKIIRRTLIHYLSFVTPDNGWYSLINSQEWKTEDLLLPYSIFSYEVLNTLQHLLHDYEKQSRIEITDDVLNSLVIWFYLFLYRIKKENYVKTDPIEKEVILTTEEFSGAKKICNALANQLRLDIPSDEVLYFSKYLLSAKVNYSLDLQLENQEMKLLRQVVEKMVSEFQLYAAVDFPEKSHMIQNLLLHLKPAFYRIKYGIKIDNVLCDSVKENYPEVFLLTKKVIHHFENLIEQPVHDNEIAYIAMHFGGWLRKEGVVLERARKKLLIVCTNGLGTSRMLESQLKGLLSDIEIIGVTSIREYEKMEIQVDIIVSTIPLPDKGVPVFVVRPVLSNEDKEALLKKVNSLYKNKSKQQIYSVDTVMDIVRRYAQIEDDQELRKELRSYFQAPIIIDDKKRKPNLNVLLPEGRIVTNERVHDWKEAIKLASSSLIKQNFINETYVEKMIENIISMGPYVVISESFALPHATASDGVYKTGMGLLHLQESIDLLGKSVQVFIILASLDNEQHLKALSQLTRLLSDKENKKIVQSGNRKRIIQLINNFSTD
ncbi:BglG family transcription antiterminator [Virgibacillus sp. MG-45]|uniref:BglG family transcription antiterminator n=1 Tax=Virgibacillus sp. MG-45 TaxID=3102791 RepID=UPI002ED99E56